VCALVVAQAADMPIPPVNTKDGVALKGYDPVAYFAVGRPTPGEAKYALQRKGANYHFANPENRARFEADPDRYAPQYGGYCAFAISIDRIADIDPERWAIVDGKLYLNNGWLAHRLWSLDEPGRIASGDRNWERFPKSTRALTPETP